jgi:hypothetical protein
MGPLHGGMLQSSALAAKQICVTFYVWCDAQQDQGLQPYAHTSPHTSHAQPRTHNSSGLVTAILENCKEFLWEAEPRGPGLPVYNSFTKQWIRIWIAIIRLIEDSVGLSKPVCCHSQGAFIGALHQTLCPSSCCLLFNLSARTFRVCLHYISRLFVTTGSII